MEPLILTHLRLKQGPEAQEAVNEWVALGKARDGLDIKEYEAQALKLIKEK
jgi:hypothetical protein